MGQTNLPSEHIFLLRAWGVVVVEIETTFTDGHTFWVSGQGFERFVMIWHCFLSIMRMNPHCGIEGAVGFGQIQSASGALEVATYGDHVMQPRLASAHDDVCAVVIEARMVEMAVGVDQHKDFKAQAGLLDNKGDQRFYKEL